MAAGSYKIEKQTKILADVHFKSTNTRGAI